MYIGETTRNIHTRSNEHFRAMKNKNTNSWMFKHLKNYNGGDVSKADFKWKVIGSFKKPILRQLSEAIEIDNAKDEESLNLKNEYFANKIRKLEVSESKKYQCNYCSQHQQNYATLMIHIEDHHKKYKCENCEDTVYGRKALMYHENLQHNNHDGSNN